MLRFSALPLVAAALLASCADPVPSNPTWFGEVRDLLAANCLRCHNGLPLKGLGTGEEPGFRLDRHVELDPDSTDTFDMQIIIPARTIDYAALGAEPMPPTIALSDREKEILANWAATGYARGERTNNRAPQIEMIEPSEKPSTVDQSLDMRLRAFDADGDGLIVALEYQEVGTGQPAVAIPLTNKESLGGLIEVSVDTGQFNPAFTYDIRAILDDGHDPDPIENETTVVLFSGLAIDHGERGTAPTVTVLSPNGGVVGPVESVITWTATDPDPGDEVLDITLELLPVNADGSLGTVQSIASGVSSPYAWDLSGLAAGVDNRYKVRVTASDTGAKNTRSDDSDNAFTIDGSDPANCSETGWVNGAADGPMKEFFNRVCGTPCHTAPPKLGAPMTFRLDRYSATDPEFAPGDRDGLFEVRFAALDAILAGRMPKMSSTEQPTTAEIAMVKEWIENCAPYDTGGGVINASPTFTWMTPSDASPMPTMLTNDEITWTVADSDGTIASGLIEYTEVTSNKPQFNADNFNCETGFDLVGPQQPDAANWQPLVSDLPTILAGVKNVAADVSANSYYCFRGSVTDDGGKQSLLETASSVVNIP